MTEFYIESTKTGSISLPVFIYLDKMDKSVYNESTEYFKMEAFL